MVLQYFSLILYTFVNVLASQYTPYTVNIHSKSLNTQFYCLNSEPSMIYGVLQL